MDESDDPLSASLHSNGKDPDFGTHAAIKIFYETRKNPGSTWVGNPPKQLDIKKVKENNNFAIKLLKVKDQEQRSIDGATPFKIQTIESTCLVKALKNIV